MTKGESEGIRDSLCTMSQVSIKEPYLHVEMGKYNLLVWLKENNSMEA